MQFPTRILPKATWTFLLVLVAVLELGAYGSVIKRSRGEAIQTTRVEMHYVNVRTTFQANFSSIGSQQNVHGLVVQTDPTRACSSGIDKTLTGHVAVIVLRNIHHPLISGCVAPYNQANFAQNSGASAIILDVYRSEVAKKDLLDSESASFNEYPRLNIPVLSVDGEDAQNLEVSLFDAAKRGVAIETHIHVSATEHQLIDQVIGTTVFDAGIFLAVVVLLFFLVVTVLIKFRWRHLATDASIRGLTKLAITKTQLRRYKHQPPTGGGGLSRCYSVLSLSKHADVSCNSLKKKANKKESKHFLSNDSCSICLEEFKHGELLRALPCRHEYHKNCIDPWLLLNRTCPLCLFDIVLESYAGQQPTSPESCDRQQPESRAFIGRFSSAFAARTNNNHANSSSARAEFVATAYDTQATLPLRSSSNNTEIGVRTSHQLQQRLRNHHRQRSRCRRAHLCHQRHNQQQKLMSLVDAAKVANQSESTDGKKLDGVYKRAVETTAHSAANNCCYMLQVQDETGKAIDVSNGAGAFSTRRKSSSRPRLSRATLKSELKPLLSPAAVASIAAANNADETSSAEGYSSDISSSTDCFSVCPSSKRVAQTAYVSCVETATEIRYNIPKQQRHFVAAAPGSSSSHGLFSVKLVSSSNNHCPVLSSRDSNITPSSGPVPLEQPPLNDAACPSSPSRKRRSSATSYRRSKGAKRPIVICSNEHDTVITIPLRAKRTSIAANNSNTDSQDSFILI